MIINFKHIRHFATLLAIVCFLLGNPKIFVGRDGFGFLCLASLETVQLILKLTIYEVLCHKNVSIHYQNDV